MDTKSFYTITAPNCIRPHSDFNVVCNFASPDVNEVISIQFVISGRDQSQNMAFLKNINAEVKANVVTLVKFRLDDLPAADYKLKIQKFTKPLIDEERSLQYKTKTQSTIIQTDKAMYKPGDKVQFRVFFIDSETKPLAIADGLNVSIQDNARNCIKQWKGVAVPQGVFKGDLQLSNNPILGMWTILTEHWGVETRKPFQVEEYVLPKFEVTVKAPAHAEFKEGKIVATVTAKYTYGKQIKGSAKVTVYPIAYMGARKPDANMALIQKTVPIDGRQIVEFDLKKDLKILQGTVSTFLLIEASVEEELTGRVLDASTMITVSEKVYHIDFMEIGKFKPGLPFTIVMRVMCQNDGPLENATEPLKVEYVFDDVETTPISYQIGKSGLVTATTNAPKTAKTLLIKAQFLKTAMEKSVEKEPSKSGTYIRAQVLSNRIVKGKNLAVSVQGTEVVPEIFYAVIGRGTLVMSGQCAKSNDHKTTFEFPTNFQMVPKATLLVYYILPDGEIVSDRLKLTFEDDLNSKISLELSPGKVQPGEDVKLTVKTAPKSYTGLLGVDQSVLLLKEENELTRENIFRELKEYEQQATMGHSPFGFRGGCYRPPFLDDFDNCGLILVTNANRLKPELEQIQPLFGRLEGGGGGGMVFGGPPMAHMKRAGPAMPMAMAFANVEMDSAPLMACSAMSAPPIVVRKEFPETWLWEDYPDNESGELNLVKKVPDTITSWIISGFSLNADSGLALTKSPAKLTVFRPFFVTATLPYSVKRGEVLKIPVTVFNYTSKDVTAVVVLDNSKNEFEFIEKGTTGSEGIQKSEVEVSADNGATTYFTVKPTKVGYIILKITATTDFAGDGIEQPLLVIAEGTKKQANKAVLLDLRAKSEEKTTLTCDIPADIIPDSVKVELSAIGDILGPTISNLDGLINVPCGCGEQTLILMVPSILVYDYLVSVDQMTPKLEDKIKNCISIGYQNELTFQHYDGAFSAFGKSDPKGSVWLTAFAIKSFTLARKLKFDLDQKVIDRALEWLCNNQASNGSFPEVGNVIHKDMQGDAGEGLALTVYTTIALIQSVDLTDAKYASIISKAVAFIGEKITECDEVYVIAMATYCLQLAKHESRDEAMKKLQKKAIVAEERKYWEKPGTGTKPSNSWCAPKSVNVEITSYALLACLAAGEDIASIPILKWLIAQRNEKGGGQSTQDTVLSLESVATFAKKIYSSNQNVELKATSAGNDVSELHITKENSLVLQKVELSDKTTKVEVVAKGSGVALVQVAYQYNVTDVVAPMGFRLDVTVNSAPNSSTLNLIVSANFIPHEDVKVSNMALLEIAFPSGFCFDSDCKRSILTIPKIRKIETQDSDTKLVIYCDNIDARGLMIPVTATKMFDVSEQKPSIVEIYDYYDNARRASKYYSMLGE